MEKKKGPRSQTISDELWEEIKEYIPRKQRDPSKHYQKAPGQGRPGLPARQVLEGIYSMFCEQDASGRPFHEKMGAATVFTGIFKNGRRQAFLKRYGYWAWKNMMSWRESAGNSRVLMAV